MPRRTNQRGGTKNALKALKKVMKDQEKGVIVQLQHDGSFLSKFEEDTRRARRRVEDDTIGNVKSTKKFKLTHKSESKIDKNNNILQNITKNTQFNDELRKQHRISIFKHF